MACSMHHVERPQAHRLHASRACNVVKRASVRCGRAGSILDTLRSAHTRMLRGVELFPALRGPASVHDTAVCALYREVPLGWRLWHGSWSSDAVMIAHDLAAYRLRLSRGQVLALIERAIRRRERLCDRRYQTVPPRSDQADRRQEITIRQVGRQRQRVLAMPRRRLPSGKRTPASCRWQEARWPGRTSRSGGASTRQRAIA